MMNKISVIIPMYNAEKSIEKLLINLSEQSFSNVEYIIVDDGSKDRSFSVVDSYIGKTKDKRFKLYHQVNRGVSSARNFGLQNASGDYIIFVDCDDRLDKEFIEKYFDKIKSANADIALFPINSIYSLDSNTTTKRINDYNFEKSVIDSNELSTKILEGYISTYLFGFIFKRSLWKDIKFNENISYKEDYLALLAILTENPKCKIVVDSHPYYWYCDNEYGLSGKYSEKRVEDGLQVSKFILDKSEISNILDYNLAINAYLVADLEAINYSIEAHKPKHFDKYSEEYLSLFKKAKFPDKKTAIKRKIQYIFIKLKMYKFINFIKIKQSGD